MKRENAKKVRSVWRFYRRDLASYLGSAIIAAAASECAIAQEQEFPLAPAAAANPLVIDVAEGAVANLSVWLADNGASLDGCDALVKRGRGELTNDFSIASFDGNIVVEAGQLVASATGSLGSALGATYVLENATLVVKENGAKDPDLSAETMIIKGTGFAGEGALYKAGGQTGEKVFGPVVLAGNALVSSSANQKTFNGIKLNGFDLTVTGVSVTHVIGEVTGPGRYIQADGNLGIGSNYGSPAYLRAENAGEIIVNGVNFASDGYKQSLNGVYEWPVIFNVVNNKNPSLYLRQNHQNVESGDNRIFYWEGPVTLNTTLRCWSYNGPCPYSFTGKVSGTGGFRIDKNVRLYLENGENDFPGGIELNGENTSLYLLKNGALPANGPQLKVSQVANKSNYSYIELKDGEEYSLPPLLVEAPLTVASKGDVQSAPGMKGSWRESIVKTDDSELVYATPVGSELLDVRAGSVRLRPVMVRTGVAGVLETYSEGVGDKTRDANYTIGVTTNGIFNQVRYTSMGNADFHNIYGGADNRMSETTWIYEGYLWVPGEEGGEPVTWTWLAGVQMRMTVYVDGKKIVDTDVDQIYIPEINVNEKIKIVQENVSLTPGRHALRIKCYTQNGYVGGKLWNSNPGQTLTAYGLMVATNNLMSTVKEDYMLMEDPGDGSFLTATPEKAVLVPNFAEFGTMKFANGTSLALEADYEAKTVSGFPSVSGANLRINEGLVLDGTLAPSKLTVAGELSFGENAVFDIVNEEDFLPNRRLYAASYVYAEATKINGVPKVADRLREQGWRMELNSDKTQLILVRRRGFMMILR